MKPKLDITSITFILFFVSLAILAGANALATEFYLYWQYLWLDIPMHALGGVVVALGFLSFYKHPFTQSYARGLFTILVIVLWVGLLWEVFEYSVDIALTSEVSYIGDSLLDVVMDIIGGVVGYAVARRLNTIDHG